MATPKKYIHDRLILLLLSIDAFLALGASVVLFIRLLGSSANGYIVQYRSNLGLNAFKTGDLANLAAFIVFILMILVIAVVLSRKAYPLRRQLAVTILAFSLVLLLFAVIVGNALLDLR